MRSARRNTAESATLPLIYGVAPMIRFNVLGTAEIVRVA